MSMEDDEILVDLADHIFESLEEIVEGYVIEKGEIIFSSTVSGIIEVLKFLKNDGECRFGTLVDVCGVDYPGREKRFEVVYNLLSLKLNHRVRVKIGVGEGEMVPSVTSLYSSAGWYEREVWDMFGIYFSDHVDLRRILTDYGFDGHPLRKDFPLTGFVEVRYDEEQRRVVYEPVKLMQDFRSFDNLSPWEGMTDIQLPGDEKGCVPEHGWSPYGDAGDVGEKKNG